MHYERYDGDLDQETADWLQAKHLDTTLSHIRADKAARAADARNRNAGMHILKTRWGIASAVTFGVSCGVEDLLRSISKGVTRLEYRFDEMTGSRFMITDISNDISWWFLRRASNMSFNRLVKAHSVIPEQDQAEAKALRQKADAILEPLHQAVHQWMQERGIDPEQEVYQTSVCHALQKIEKIYPQI